MCTVLTDTGSEMAKSNKSKPRVSRDHSPIANHRLREPKPSPRPVSLSRTVFTPPAAPPREDLRLVEDRRTFHPEQANRPAKLRSGLPAPVTVTNRTRDKPRTKSARAQINRFGVKVHSQTKGILTFAAPKETLVCVRRQRRKEVLFAKKRTGSGNRNPKRTWLSKISCRR